MGVREGGGGEREMGEREIIMCKIGPRAPGDGTDI